MYFQVSKKYNSLNSPLEPFNIFVLLLQPWIEMDLIGIVYNESMQNCKSQDHIKTYI